MERTEGVKGPAPREAPERWCDVLYPAADAPPLVLPRVEAARAGGPLPSLRTDRWTWVNLWATWCVPCKREMPLLLRWHDRLAGEGVPFDLWFVSVDERQEELAQFLHANPTFAPGTSVRIATVSELGPWLARFPGAPTDVVPVQILAAPGGTVRCIRAGSLADGDFPIVKALLTTR